MDRDTAVSMAQQAIKAQNQQIVEDILKLKAEREAQPHSEKPIAELPLIGVTCSTGWECHAIVHELSLTRKYRVRAMYRSKGTRAEERLQRLVDETEKTHPGLLEMRAGVDMYSEEVLTREFADCHGVVLYVTANSAKAGQIENHGNDPLNGRAAVMRQAVAMVNAVQANPSIQHCVTLVFPPDKVTGVTTVEAEIPWWIDQRLRITDFFRGQGLNVTCVHRPAYYYGLHRVDYTTSTADFRGETALSRNLIKEDTVPGINEPDFTVNWVDVRDIGKWVGTIFEYPEVFSNINFSMASCVMSGDECVERCHKINKHGTTFKYKQFPQWVMKMISLFNNEVIYPLRYSQWYNADGNAYDFAHEDDLADLDRIHPRWTFEQKLESWGIDELKPGAK
ncbi:NmrA family NAD(P)-binding protein [Oceanicoccus sagamiensis]|uniref:NmrA-like domain-containing protein n=1 Tax=Oceanicoccus sagamiensis TaxID=716816 RepID=A0A1X9NF84_9GAMM|nr:NmrA family NAD(P)-binding protein [Oceanicoccus sagamiensis]ARN75831.1 hypothetical protein BST96_18000 [Oceanicoccus sagamiensis]